MTQEDKDLLLKDLCTRLPYGVKGIITYDDNKNIFAIKGIFNILFLSDAECCHVEDFKPYLRPMSNMTEEEQDKFLDLIICVDNGKAVVEEDKIYAYNNFIYSHHLDNKNFIERGFALEAPKGMYN